MARRSSRLKRVKRGELAEPWLSWEVVGVNVLGLVAGKGVRVVTYPPLAKASLSRPVFSRSHDLNLDVMVEGVMLTVQLFRKGVK